MRRVILGTPSHDGKVDVYYAHSLVESVRLCSRINIDLRPLFLAYDSMLQNVRNDLVAAAVKFGFDDLIFADADQGWNPEWIPKLLSYPVDCVGAAVVKKTDKEELYNVRTTGGPLSFTTHETAPILTAQDMALGCGFIRLSKKAFTALWDNAEEYVGYKGKEPSRWIFDIRPVNGELVGEDVLMSDKLRKLGIATWVDPHMTCSHIGVKKYDGDFASYLAKLRIQKSA